MLETYTTPVSDDPLSVQGVCPTTVGTMQAPDNVIIISDEQSYTREQQVVHDKLAAMAAMAALGACSGKDLKILHRDISMPPRPQHTNKAAFGHVVGRDNGKSKPTQERNEPCNCGSGLKFKKCCIGKK